MDCRQQNDAGELEAWKTMMDSMIKFIHASTKLMNTYNQKAADQILPSLCELQCPPCVDTKNQRRCSANASSKPDDAAKPAQQQNTNATPTNIEKVTPTIIEDPTPTITEAPTPTIMEDPTPTNIEEVTPTIMEDPAPNDMEEAAPADSENVTPDMEDSSPGEDVVLPEAEETPLAENTPDDASPPQEESADYPEESVKVPDRDETSIVGSTGRSEVSATPAPRKSSSLPQESVKAPERDVTPIVESTRRSEGSTTPVPRKESKAAEGGKQAGGDVCVCKTVKEIKSIISQAVDKPDSKGAGKKCGCGPKKSKPQLCACPATSKETANLTESMVQKLEKAQGEIDGLKKELQRLQFMESTRKSNSAALYREIMKETSLDTGPPSMRGAPSCPSSCTSSQQRRPPSAMSTVRSNNQTAARWSQSTQNGQPPDPTYHDSFNTAFLSDNGQPPSDPTYHDSYNTTVSVCTRSQPTQNRQRPCPVYQELYNTAVSSNGQPSNPTYREFYNTAVSSNVQDSTQRWYNDTSRSSRFSPAVNSTMVPRVQYNEVECVYNRPKTPPQNMTNRYRTAGFQGVMQAAIVCAQPRTYAQPPVYSDTRDPYENEEYDDIEDPLCDDYSCGNDECESRGNI